MGIFSLPDGYREIKRVDFRADKQLMILINVWAIAITVVMVIIGFVIRPTTDTSPGGLMSLMTLLRTAAVIVSVAVYIVLHELVHGVFIKRYSGKKAKYGFVGLYAYAGSGAYFGKRQYLTIALSPVLLLGIGLLLLGIFMPPAWFWVIYIVQITNISGAVGDYYITRLARKLPSDILVKDEGVSMVIYSKMSI